MSSGVFFFMQNQLPEKIIGKGRVIYHIKALSVVNRTKHKNVQNVSRAN